MKVLSKFKTGSILYGTNNENSDIDISGVFLESFEDIINPFKTTDELDLSVVSKKEDGKNDKDATDEKLYSFRKFVKLAYDNNPNIVEFLFVKDFLYIDDSYKEFLNNSELFINKNIFNKFYGYAISQENKMYIKSSRYNRIKEFNDYLKKIHNVNAVLSEFTEDLTLNCFGVYHKNLGFNNNDWYVKVAEGYEFPLNLKVKDVLERINVLMEKASWRSEMIFDKGYDYKFGSHLIRLLEECIELAETKHIEFPLKNRELIKDIKEGKYTINQLKVIIDDRKSKLKDIELNSNLPDHLFYRNDVLNLVKNFYKKLFMN